MSADLTTVKSTENNRHHLMIGGCGAVGVAFSDYVSRVGDDVSIFAREKHVNRLKHDAVLRYFDVNGYMLKHIGYVLLAIVGCCFPMVFFGFRLLTFFVAILNLRIVPPVVAHFYSVFFPMALKEVPIKGAISTPEGVAKLHAPVSHMWLCTSSPQMRKMVAEVSEICEAVLKTFQPSEAVPKPVFVSLTPGMTDGEFLLANVPALKSGKVALVLGSIPIIAYQHPMMGARYSFAPFLKTPSIVLFTSPDPIKIISDDATAKASTAAALSSMSTHQADLSNPETRKARMLPEAFFTSVVLTIEGCQWQFAGVANPWVTISMVGSMLEMKAAFEASKTDGEPKLASLPDLTVEEAKFLKSSRLFSLPVLGMFAVAYPVLLLVSLVHMLLLPFDLERYFEYHFLKVGDQMSGFASLGLRVAQREGLPCGHSLAVYKDAIESRENRVLSKRLRQEHVQTNGANIQQASKPVSAPLENPGPLSMARKKEGKKGK